MHALIAQFIWDTVDLVEYDIISTLKKLTIQSKDTYVNKLIVIRYNMINVMMCRDFDLSIQLGILEEVTSL